MIYACILVNSDCGLSVFCEHAHWIWLLVNSSIVFSLCPGMIFLHVSCIGAVTKHYCPFVLLVHSHSEKQNAWLFRLLVCCIWAFLISDGGSGISCTYLITNRPVSQLWNGGGGYINWINKKLLLPRVHIISKKSTRLEASLYKDRILALR